MKPYRKDDQYYYDIYDRYTIKEAKEFQAKVLPEMTDAQFHALEIRYHDFIKIRYRNRTEETKKMMQEDEEKDRLVSRYRVPEGITCEQCGKKLILCTHLFNSFNERLLFVFECVNPDHKPRTLVLPNGEIKYTRRPVCKKCGEPIVSSTRKKGLKLTVTDKCPNCGEKNVDVFDMTPDPPINDEERKIFCLTNYGSNTFMEDLKAFADIVGHLNMKKKEEKEKKKYSVDKIQVKTIPQIKELLSKEIGENGFNEFTFDKPVTGRYMMMPFTVMDTTSRKENESTSALKKQIVKILTYTNWRLSGTIDYRLGMLTGKLKAVETDDDLLELAKKIHSDTDES